MSCFLIKDIPEQDRSRLIKMCLVHDVCESIVGDITPLDGISTKEKYNREFQAMEYISGLLPSDTSLEIRELWLEFEAGETLHSRIVKDIDKYDMILQAFEYEKEQGLDLTEFFCGVESFSTEEIRNWAIELYEVKNK